MRQYDGTEPGPARRCDTVTTGGTASSANGTRDLYAQFLTAAARCLDHQPSARTVRTAGRHLHHGLTNLVEKLAEERTC